ncbi:MAG: hypothetical protein K2O70_04280, partial [Desulfovibrionaceae bacterium]|nr:hypothetical protein [Desulfovibrionaceae bacterium]
MQVQRAEHSGSLAGILVRPVDDALARRLSDGKRSRPFAEVFGSVKPKGYLIGPGDTIVVSVWET